MTIRTTSFVLILLTVLPIFGQMNKLEDHGLVAPIHYLTEKKVNTSGNDTILVSTKEADSIAFYFNQKTLVDSVIALSNGVISYKVYFRYENGRLVKRLAERKIDGKIVLMTSEYSYAGDTTYSKNFMSNASVRIGKSITTLNDSIKRIESDQQILIQHFNGKKQLVKLEVKDGNDVALTSVLYGYNEKGLRKKVTNTWPNDKATSSENYVYDYDELGNWIRRKTYTMVGFENRFSPIETLRVIKY